MPQSQSSKSQSCRGFTLIEVLISVAIVLLLVTGINLIFSVAGKAVGAGQALSESSRNNQSAQGVMYSDFNACATDDSPFIIIYSHATPAFRTLADQQGDRDYKATDSVLQRQQETLTVDLDNNGTEGEAGVPGELISPASVNDRNHRTDIVTFCARDQYKRQTGYPGTYVAKDSSNEAMIWYGHLCQPDNSGTFLTGGVEKTAPGQGVAGMNSNPNNSFATQWILGREAILLTPRSGLNIVDQDNKNQNYIQDTGVGLAPLAYKTAAYTTPQGLDTSDAQGSAIQSSRYDLADTSLNAFREKLKNPPAGWWLQFMDTDFNATSATTPSRFWADPFIAKPLTSAEFAKTTPIFLRGCTQFIVEYAGDFITQNPSSGALLGASPYNPDNTIDFVVGADGQHQIRWYGFPRDTDLSNDSPGSESILSNGAGGNSHDVVPARDVRTDAATFTFEHFDNLPKPAGGDYASTGSTLSDSDYYCAWGPTTTESRPSLIRITYTLDDPGTALTTPLTYEYIFKIR